MLDFGCAIPRLRIVIDAMSLLQARHAADHHFPRIEGVISDAVFSKEEGGDRHHPPARA
jgi:hypothetical protein